MFAYVVGIDQVDGRIPAYQKPEGIVKGIVEKGLYKTMNDDNCIYFIDKMLSATFITPAIEDAILKVLDFKDSFFCFRTVQQCGYRILYYKFSGSECYRLLRMLRDKQYFASLAMEDKAKLLDFHCNILTLPSGGEGALL